MKKAFAEVRITNGPKGVVIGRDGDILLLQVGSGLNSYRVVVLETQIEGTPNLSRVSDLSWQVFKTYMV